MLGIQESDPVLDLEGLRGEGNRHVNVCMGLSKGQSRHVNVCMGFSKGQSREKGQKRLLRGRNPHAAS